MVCFSKVGLLYSVCILEVWMKVGLMCIFRLCFVIFCSKVMMVCNVMGWFE